jgi:hypothetical protein
VCREGAEVVEVGVEVEVEGAEVVEWGSGQHVDAARATGDAPGTEREERRTDA